MKQRKALAMLTAMVLTAGMLSGCSEESGGKKHTDRSSSSAQTSDGAQNGKQDSESSDETGEGSGGIVYDDDDSPDTQNRGALIRRSTNQGYTRAAGGRNRTAASWSSLKPEKRKKMTLMVYMVGSNLESLGGAASDDIMEMIDSGFVSKDVNLIVYCGGAKSWSINLQSNVNNYLIYDPDDQSFAVIPDTKKSMGAAETFASFMNEVPEKYPAEHYGLICWDHGGGPLGFGNDETYPDPEGMQEVDSLTLKEMKTALKQTPFAGNKLDFVGFDACLMSSLEVTEVWKDYASLMIASTDLEPGCGWDYTFLETLNSTIETQAVAESIINHYADFIRANRSPRFDPDYSLFAIDLNKADELLSRSEALFAAMDKAFRKGKSRRIITCRKRVHVYGGSRDTASSTDMDITDFGEFAKELSDTIPTETKALGRTLHDMIVYGRTNIKGCRGMTVYFPDNESFLYQLWGRDFIAENDYAPNYVHFMDTFSKRWGGTASRAYDSFAQEQPEQPSQGDDPASIYTTYQLTEDQLSDFSDAYYTVMRKVSKSNQVGLDRDESTDFLTVVEQIPVYPDENGVLKLDLNPEVILVDTGSHTVERDAIPVPFSYVGENGEFTQYQSHVTAVGTDVRHFPFHQNAQFVSVDLKTKTENNLAQIMNISVRPAASSDTTTSVQLSGKSTLSGEDQHLFYFHVHPAHLKDTELETSTTPYTELSNETAYFSMYEFEEGFGFMHARLSDVYIPDTYYYQLIINDFAGKPHANPITAIGMETEYSVAVEKTDKGEMQFTVFEDHAELFSYVGEDAELELPAQVSGKPITVIGREAFGDNKTLTSLKIPEPVEKIGSYAFSGCNVLTSIELPKTLKEIGALAFAYTEVEELELPEGLEAIGSYAFNGSKLKAIHIGKNVSQIRNGAFCNMPQITSLTVDAQNSAYMAKDNVLFTKDGKTLVAFVGRFRESYTIPEGVEVIAVSAFEGSCSSPLRDNYTVEENNFMYPDEDGFWHFVGLKEIRFPKSLKRIEASAFYNVIAIQKLEFPENLEYIGPAAFVSDQNYVERPDMEIRIPAKLTHIAYHAFAAYKEVTFTVDPKNPVYAAKDGRLTNLSGDTEIYVHCSDEEGLLLKKPEDE